MSERVKTLTFQERAVWGECEVCGAKDEQPCDPQKGFPLGATLCGERLTNGVHLARLNSAPKEVRIIPV